MKDGSFLLKRLKGKREYPRGGGTENIMEYLVGVDLGGTNTSVGAVDLDGNLIKELSRPSGDDGVYSVADVIISLCKELIFEYGKPCGIGIGVPGAVCDGTIIRTVNLPISYFEIGKMIESKLGVKYKLINDANAAALGEYTVMKMKAENVVLMTIGTGIGGGIIIDGKIYEGANGTAGEIGHTVIRKGGLMCTCGRRGCFERYASANALKRQTARAAKLHPESMLANAEKISGKTAFDCARAGDKAASEVVDKYIEYVGEGVCNLINIFQPEYFLIGGGISNEGEYFISRVRDYVRKREYNQFGKRTEIRAASLCNDAGIIGAALYAME